jgi:hypothetical protein
LVFLSKRPSFVDYNYAKYLFSYIHLNPIKLFDPKWREYGINDFKKAKDFLKNYRWSSYVDYKSYSRTENRVLNREFFPEYFQNIKDFDSEIFEWLIASSAEEGLPQGDKI